MPPPVDNRLDRFRRRAEIRFMHWYWWVVTGVGFLFLVYAVILVTSFLDFLHTAN